MQNLRTDSRGQGVPDTADFLKLQSMSNVLSDIVFELDIRDFVFKKTLII